MRTSYRRKGWLCAVLVVALCLTLAWPQLNSLARTFIEVDQECSLTLVLDEGGLEKFADLQTTDIIAHVFQIATVDTYARYTVLDEYKDLFELDVVNGETSAATAKAWEAKAREIAGKLGLPVPEVQSETTPGTMPGTSTGGSDTQTPEQSGTTPGTSTDGSDTQDKEQSETTPGTTTTPSANAGKPFDWTQVASKETFSLTIPAGKTTATREKVPMGMYLVCVESLETGEYVYDFLPYLVAVPNNYYRAEDQSSVDAWIYDVEVGLKPQRTTRYLDLEIVKSLFTYNESLSGDNEDSATNTSILGGAMFVFQVDAVKKEIDADGEVISEQVVYSNVLGMNFKEPGQQRILVKKIPAGSEVTIKEIYTGASYKLTGWGGETWNPESEVFTGEADNPTVVIEKLLGSSKDVNGGYDDEGIEIAAKVTFTNDYDETTTFGSGIINHFTYFEDTKKWVGVQIKDGTSGGGSSR